MGWSVPHVSKKGRTTNRAYFRDMRGETVYEGTYATEKESDKAWQAAEARIADPLQGHQATASPRSRRKS
ncbi:hypothetical protein [Glycomyces artemisiae]|uniref:AP2-like DNA-binding integrase family protein n=1 Tax=Glycomyces artemisiae TaxID=1076443 RepID=A0A2T0UF88_9ACTN|nr:hypothetical protein [Glycomyces artemisiae]PRY56605.1 hypothetical protein B0I28_109254 [Glycomyces artemisiae]